MRKALNVLSWILAALMWAACILTLMDLFPGGWALGVTCQIVFGISAMALATFLE